MHISTLLLGSLAFVAATITTANTNSTLDKDVNQCGRDTQRESILQ